MCFMRNHAWNKAKNLPVVYLQKYTLCHTVCAIINAFLPVLKDVDVIFSTVVFKQLELTNLINFRMLSLLYNSLYNV